MTKQEVLASEAVASELLAVAKEELSTEAVFNVSEAVVQEAKAHDLVESHEVGYPTKENEKPQEASLFPEVRFLTPYVEVKVDGEEKEAALRERIKGGNEDTAIFEVLVKEDGQEEVYASIGGAKRWVTDRRHGHELVPSDPSNAEEINPVVLRVAQATHNYIQHSEELVHVA